MYAVAILSLVFDVSVSESVKRDHLNQLIKENEAKKPTAIHDAIAKNPFEPITKPPKLPRTRTQRKDSPSSSSSSSSEASDDDNYSMHDDESKLHQHLFHQRATVILNCQQLLLLLLLLLQDRCRGFSIVGHCEPLANLRMPWTWHWRCLML
jgi:hypothetical protein